MSGEKQQERLDQLAGKIPMCMSRDQHDLLQNVQRLRRIATAKHNEFEQKLAQLEAKVASSANQRQARLEHHPTIHFPEELPVSQRREDIAAAIRDNQVVIVAGETGSGKTTQLPKICLELGRGSAGFIGHTQPRRIAARSVAARIAEELSTPLGEAVGFKVRFSDHTKKSSHIKLMTDGILLAELQGDRYLSEYDTIIIDEAHERSLNIDFLLGYLKQLLPKRPDLKVIITSATIDTERFSQHFDNAPIIEVSGRSYPVEIRYHGVEDDEGDAELTDAVLSAVDELAKHDDNMRAAHPQLQGDILVFLSGEREIRDVDEALSKHHPNNTEILPLYSRLSANEQSRVFKRGNKRRIVLATNVAETSITVPGIRYVIDPGKARISRYSFRSKVQRLPVEKIAQSSANQRAGRCGRLSDGICIRLYTEEDFLARPLYTQPEIQRTNLASVILQMRQLGLGDPSDFPFIDPPDQRFINDGYRLLLELNAIDEKRKLTAIGKQLARLPIDPRLGRMVLAAEGNNCLEEVLIIVSALSVQDPRERPADKQQQADAKHKRFSDDQSDFVAMLNLWAECSKQKRHLSHNKFRKYCKQEFLSFMRVKEWVETFQQLHSQTKGMGMKFNSTPAGYDAIHCALLTGLLGNIGVKTERVEKQKEKRKSSQRYQGARNTEFFIFPGSGLAKKSPSWLMSAELVETSRLYARQNARIEPEWIESAAQHLVKRTYSEPHWNPKRGLVMADETVTLYGLVLTGKRRVPYGTIDPELSRKIFIQEALVEGNYRTRAAFFSHNRTLIEEAKSLESKTRRQNVLVEDGDLFHFFDERIPADIHNHVDFEQWRKGAELQQPDILKLARSDVFTTSQSLSRRDYPGEIVVNGVSLQLKYCFSPGADDDGVTAVIPLGSLNQFKQAQFDYLVSGFFEEKVIAMLKGLPKNIRKQLVPIPEFAASILPQIEKHITSTAETLSLSRRLALIIRETKRIDVKESDWRLDLLPLHLTMRFEVVDQNNKTLGYGRSLDELQARFGEHAAEELEVTQAQLTWPADGLTSWQFGDLPESVMIERGTHKYRAYPAIVDKQTSVGIGIFDSPENTIVEHKKGLCRLALLENNKAVKYLFKNLPHIKTTCLHYSLVGSCEQLKDDFLMLLSSLAYFSAGYSIRNESDFSACLEKADPLMPLATQLDGLVFEIMDGYKKATQQFHAIDKHCARTIVNDISAQLHGLVYEGFLRQTSYERLQELPRYFRALSMRMEKLRNAPGVDQKNLDILMPFLQEYDRLQQQVASGVDAGELEKLRWLLEEFRVSLFAQPLKTAVPVSVKRIEKQIKQCHI